MLQMIGGWSLQVKLVAGFDPFRGLPFRRTRHGPFVKEGAILPVHQEDGMSPSAVNSPDLDVNRTQAGEDLVRLSAHLARNARVRPVTVWKGNLSAKVSKNKNKKDSRSFYRSLLVSNWISLSSSRRLSFKGAACWTMSSNRFRLSSTLRQVTPGALLPKM